MPSQKYIEVNAAMSSCPQTLITSATKQGRQVEDSFPKCFSTNSHKLHGHRYSLGILLIKDLLRKAKTGFFFSSN